jgi:hypothetical protein
MMAAQGVASAAVQKLCGMNARHVTEGNSMMPPTAVLKHNKLVLSQPADRTLRALVLAW